ncbi:MAG: aminomethyl-transferring glycine dehydrogenase subunit GcvPB [Candidatus Brocadiia bacterium]
MQLIFEQSKPGRKAYTLPELDVPAQEISKLIPAQYLRTGQPALPEVDELTLVRHYTALSRRNTGVDNVFYPLGSCTMKYNPKINESLAALDGFNLVHPYQPEETVQGMLEMIYNLAEYLREISGLPGVTLLPAAGAHGEFTGIKVIKACLQAQGDARKQVLIPDSAHGTNPASVAFSGYQPVEVKSDARGNVDIADLKAKINNQTAAIMLTIPNTLGLFDEHILEVADIVHKAGAFVYMDGANLNSIMGIVKPADLGVDVMHFNLHKTFSTPHGGGGPGSGPIAVSAKLKEYLPPPYVVKNKDKFSLVIDAPGKAVGRLKGFYGHINVLIKAYVYVRMMGPAGLKQVSEMAVLNANYIMSRLKPDYHLSYDRYCMHECVLDGTKQLKENGVRTLDIAKRLIDYGFHPPTIYFPLIVHEAIMIEPTETESKETLDGFIIAMKQIADESAKNPALVKSAPQTAPVKRLDEVKAAKELVVRYTPGK